MSDNITTAWEKMQIIRNKNRPTALDYIPMIFDDFLKCTVIDIMAMTML